MPDVKNAVFSIITIVVIPLLFFVLLELGLAAFGVGTSFDYFHEIDIDGQTYYQENPDFADQFYPPSLGIGPLENTFSKERSPGSLRVYILGGSAAMGFPLTNHGLDRVLSAQLRAALPSRKIEVINTAMTSVNSHVVYAVAKSIPDDSADFAVILMGNNEVVGPYGPGTFNQNFLESINVIRGIQSLKRTRIWQALEGMMRKIRPGDAKQELEWEGMQMFTNHGVTRDDPRMESVYSHYERNLGDIIEILQKKGIHVVLSSVPVNLRHSAPFLSVHDPGLPAEQLDQWRETTREGAEHSDREDWTGAVKRFQSALEIDPAYADTHFRLATALENLGKFQEARTHYRLAMDLDALRFRTDSRMNEIIRAVAERSRGDRFSYVDNVAAFDKASQPFQPGWNLFFEHVHFDFPGNHVLANELSQVIAENLAEPRDFEPLSGDEVARRIGFPNYDTIGDIRNLQGMTEHPPFPGQSNYTDLRKFLDDRLDSVTDEVGSSSDVVHRREELVDQGLADWKIHFELAVLNERLHNRQAMYDHLDRILELYPHNRETYMKIAEALSKDGRWSEVIRYLEQSLYYTRGDEQKIAETTGWLGTAFLRTGDDEKATDMLLEVTKKYPDQIGLTFRAYGNLIRFARENGNVEELERYVRDVQGYARTLIRDGKEKEFPLLYRRMSQLMTLAGYEAEAKEWASKQQ